ncbi:MAG: NAD(P)/FAD-dependent oxidoreductase [bacterium]|nr:NAD(P)/FAD-dependent oxidoreductase [bacterium]
MKQFDLIVIGTGSAGVTTAFACREAGWSVALIDSRPFGGTCALRGCDPKKVLVGLAELADWSRRMHRKGITNEIHVDWPALMRFKRSFTEPVPAKRERSFAEAGIAAFHGRARFTDRTTVQVGAESLAARFVVIANGAKPMDLGIPGQEYLTTSEGFLDLDTLPDRIVFVGGGYISFEFAHVAARIGAHVQILHRGQRPLGGFDPDLVEQLTRASRDLGIDIHLNTEVLAIEKQNGQLVIRAKQSDTEERFAADLVVHGAGRVSEIDDLRLDVACVARTKRGVAVNEYLQSTTNSSVYAAGDAAAGPGLPLTPVAATEGEIVAENLLHGNRRTANFNGLASIVYTVPALAAVGLGEAGARERGLRFHVRAGDTSTWYSPRRLGVEHSGYKVLIDEREGLILGAHILGPHAEELANLFSLAIHRGIPAKDLGNAPYAYPTGASDIEYMV